MVAINFSILLDKVENRQKMQTIRPHKNLNCFWCRQKGKKAHLFKGLRTKNCRRLGEGSNLQIKTVPLMDFTMQIAERDGFDWGVQIGFCEEICKDFRHRNGVVWCHAWNGYEATHCTPVFKLVKFLERCYDGKFTHYDVLTWDPCIL